MDTEVSIQNDAGKIPKHFLESSNRLMLVVALNQNTSNP